jgi:hypothetical protein
MLLLSAGCAKEALDISPRAGVVKGMTVAEVDALAEDVRENPRDYLQTVLKNTRALDEYKLVFTRYERRGLFGTLYGPERIMAWYRQDPFSVRLKWLDEDIKYDESVYVADQHDGKVRFVTRTPQAFLKPPPEINVIDPMMSVTFGESKRPITDFGLERLMERTLNSLAESGDDAVIEYVAVEVMPETEQPVHHLRLRYSGKRHSVPIQELFINIRTDLPAGTELRFESGRLDSAYYYDEIDTDVNLSDEDFLLSVEREPSAG